MSSRPKPRPNKGIMLVYESPVEEVKCIRCPLQHYFSGNRKTSCVNKDVVSYDV